MLLSGTDADLAAPPRQDSPSAGYRFAADDLASLRDAFEREGFCVAAGLFAPGEVAEIRDFFQDVERLRPLARRGSFDAGRDTGDPDDPLKRYPRYIHPHRDHEVARRHLLHPGVRRVLAHLLGQDALAVQSMYYYKPPGARGQGMHQDNIYLLAAPHTCIAAWTAIDRCDGANGAIVAVPGSHRSETICERHGADASSFTGGGLKLRPGTPVVTTEMEPGDTLFFNGQLIHGSGPNRTTDRWRRSFICHYVPEVTESLSRFYFPVLDFAGLEVDRVAHTRGGPCGGDWAGAAH